MPAGILWRMEGGAAGGKPALVVLLEIVGSVLELENGTLEIRYERGGVARLYGHEQIAPAELGTLDDKVHAELESVRL